MCFFNPEMHFFNTKFPIPHIRQTFFQFVLQYQQKKRLFCFKKPFFVSKKFTLCGYLQ